MTDATLVHERADTPSATTAVTGRHLPALNGLRGVAVIGVVAYHLQIGWAKGGYLGVDLFFVLSGFLITTLLLEEWVGSGRINLAAFWGRRARRLLPALFLVVAALALYLVCNAAFGGPGANGLIDLSGMRGDAIATLLYVNNWHLIFAHQSYFAQFSTPSPLQHTWSLAIEEQFYLVWPLVLLVLLRYGRRGWRRIGADGHGRPRRRFLGADGGAVPSRRRSRRASTTGPIRGCSISWRGRPSPSWRRRGAQPGAQSRRTLHWVGPVAAVVLGVFWVRAGTSGGLPTNFMFEGGFLLCAALAGLVVADARLVEPGRFARGLAWRPLHFIGTISYGIYLWHWPVIVYLNGARTGLSDLAPGPPAGCRHAARSRPRATTWSSGRSAWPSCAAASACGSRPLAGVVTAVAIVVATIPAVADPATVAGTTHLASSGSVQAVPGAGGYAGQQPIRLAPAPSAADPLRVMIIGDSVMHDASYGITASLQATGEATVATQHHRRVRAHDGDQLAHVHSQPHPPDPGPADRGLVELGPVRADHAQRAAPARAVHRPAPARRRHHAGAGQRRRGRHLHPVPPVG